MNLIDIGYKNTLINPERIDYIEQRKVGITEVTYICICGKEFMLGIPLEEFWAKIAEKEETKQEFGG